MSAPSPSTTDSAYRRVQIRTANPAIASRGVSQPRNTKLSRPVPHVPRDQVEPGRGVLRHLLQASPAAGDRAGNRQRRDEHAGAYAGRSRKDPRNHLARPVQRPQDDVEEEERHARQRQVHVGERNRGERGPRQDGPPTASLQRPLECEERKRQEDRDRSAEMPRALRHSIRPERERETADERRTPSQPELPQPRERESPAAT